MYALSVHCVFLRLTGGAGASAHLEKTANCMEGMQKSLVRHFLAERKTAECKIIFFKIRSENSSKNACRETCGKPSEIFQKSPNMPPKINPGGLRNLLACQVGARRLLKSLAELPRKVQTHFHRGQSVAGAIFTLPGPPEGSGEGGGA